MLLKKYSYLLFAALLSTAIVGCDDDEGITDDTKPTANLTSPTADQLTQGFQQGSSLTVTGTVSDNRDLESVTLTITGPSEASAWFTKTWTENDFSGNTANISETIAIPATAPVGTHVMTLTAIDDAENMFTQSWDINVMAPATNANFTITVPAGTPETAEIYLAGLDNTDDSDEMYLLTRNEDGTYSGNFAFPMDQAEPFYFRVKSTDPANADMFREVNADCTEFTEEWIGTNRTFTGTADAQDMTYTVAAWQGMDAAMGGCTAAGGDTGGQ